MKNITCPKCGTIFQVDEADYASILNQVRNAEFQEELEQRLNEAAERSLMKQQAEQLKAQQEFQRQLAAKETEINALKSARTIELTKLQAVQKEEVAKLENAKNNEINQLKAQIIQADDRVKMAVLEEQNRQKDELQQRENQIAALRTQMASEKTLALQREQQQKELYEQQLQQKQDEVNLLKDMKTRLSTKMIGETLEQHCYNQFNLYKRPSMPHAYFEKDNEVIGGSKGDFIFRDYDDEGYEYISIMFEMKNEMDTTATKHKNEDFLKKLDEDRQKKGCEYAVLVSLLELDNEYYNSGIVDMSHRFPKMYVVRPQCFIPLISLLVQAAMKNIDLRKQLTIAQSQSVDVTNFENKLTEFKGAFSYNVNLYKKKFAAAIAEIDKSIAELQKAKNDLLGAGDQLGYADNKLDDLTIRKLTYKNPTMKAKFDEARENQANENQTDGEHTEVK